MQVTFNALVKMVRSLSLVSGDKQYQVEFRGEDGRMLEAGTIPGDKQVKVEITLLDE